MAPAALQPTATGEVVLAVGVPGEDVGDQVDAGAINVGYRGSPLQQFSQNSAGAGRAEHGDRFGSAFAAGDFDGDGLDDLAIGVPGEDVGAVANAGAVNVLYGSASGLTSTRGQLFTQHSGQVGTPESGDAFGSSLAAGDFDGDGYVDLAIGVRGEDFSGLTNAGAVNVLYGSAGGLTAGGQVLTQNSAGAAASAEAGDRFGSSLAAADFDHDGYADLAAGAPGEDVFAVSAAGAVNVLYGAAGGLSGSRGQLFIQGAGGIPGSAEAGDGFGLTLAVGYLERNDAYADLAIGTPHEDISAATDAGVANVLSGTAAGLTGTGSRQLTENTYAPGSAEAGDAFGFALAAVSLWETGEQLMVGAPGEDVGAVVDAGVVSVSGWVVSENTADMEGTAERGDRFGAALARSGTTEFANLAIGVPGEGARDEGAVMVITGVRNDGDQLPPAGHLFDQGRWASTPEPDDGFGAILLGAG